MTRSCLTVLDAAAPVSQAFAALAVHERRQAETAPASSSIAIKSTNAQAKNFEFPA
jgi:hypothetical protein